MKIAPSILSVKIEEYPKVIKELENLDISYLHLDIMDGKFVPNSTYDAEEVKNIRKMTSMFLDTHLMIENPENYINSYINAGSDSITFHFEATTNVKKIIKMIKDKNLKCGISIKPKTNVDVLLPYLSEIDMVLVMSVEPGFGGQKFMDSALNKIKQLANLRMTNHYSYLIEVDGGINNETSKLCKNAGADIIVVGTYLMNSNNKKETIKELNK
ncbi:MAG: ribulose-phosphate 3-epimerase [Bacilli bacterium]|nr:ribulose-phosphate 3-epimerase [Bacilli bacterium]MDY4052358.1 ribulose-phosphate 3-epimerase [Bacilli bacterium]